MALPLVAILAIAAAEATRKTIQKSRQRGRETKQQAATTRWSPWTNMEAPAPTTKPDPQGDFLKAFLMGNMISQGVGGGGGVETSGGGLVKTSPERFQQMLLNRTSNNSKDPFNRFA